MPPYFPPTGRRQKVSPRGRWSWSAAITGLLMAATPGTVLAQCPNDLRTEVMALDAVVDSVLAKAKGKATNSSEQDTESAVAFYRRATQALQTPEVYIAAVASTGAAAPCLIERREVFRATATNLLLRDSAKLSEQELERALRLAAAAVLSTRYAPTDRVGVLFGIGFGGVLNIDEPELVKVVQRDTGDARRSFIVRESPNRAGPVALTGIGIRFRDAADGWDRFIPAAAFASIQFGVGDDPVRGAALGIGWPLVGDSQILLGFNLSRIQALREDLVAEFRDSRGRMEFPIGESAESILGTRTSAALLIALGVPVSLKAAFGNPQ